MKLGLIWHKAKLRGEAQCAVSIFQVVRASLSRKPECPDHDTKLHLIVKLQSWSSGECGVTLHWHYSQIQFD